jgi:enamine deaminase RidA (YjgF/YER057c/UK114 family)
MPSHLSVLASRTSQHRPSEVHQLTTIHFVFPAAMAHLQYFSYPGFGESCREKTHYSQAVHVGDQLIISGQGLQRPSLCLLRSILNRQ